jgi:hypothetical protein
MGKRIGGEGVAEVGRRALCGNGLGETILTTWTTERRSRKRGWSSFWTGWNKRG